MLGGVAALTKLVCESAIAKHDECAAAISSSGLVFPSERSVLEAQVTVRSPTARRWRH